MLSLSPEELTAIKLSLRVATLATLASLPLGILIALLLARRRFYGRALLNALVLLPLVLPPVVTGYVLLLLFGRHVLLVALLSDVGPLTVIGIMQATFGRVLYEIDRRRRVACLAACTPGSRAASSRFTGWRRLASCRAARSRLIPGRSWGRLILGAGLPRKRAKPRDHNNCQKSRDDFAHSSVSLP